MAVAAHIQKLRTVLNASQKNLPFRLEVEEGSFEAEASRQLAFKTPFDSYNENINWADLHNKYPHLKNTFNQFESFIASRQKAMDSEFVGLSSGFHQAFMAKLDDMEQEALALRAPLAQLQKELKVDIERLKERKMFLVEEKIGNILKDRPDWVQIIKEDLENMNWNNPLEGTVLDEE
eukprot:TRINITY_DN8297_c0_g1_i1.p1 TRINITY_DN8297_c0_g1~~TRINITY_DN8297_c0_g1_i1.p1  ORF type:complete len:178 (-),score=36.14 TRINITY_DN8297_c0_g1_i1:28-561(-)